MSGPIEQFEIKPIVPIEVSGYDITFTNSSLFMCLAVILSVTFLGFAIRKKALVPGVLQSIPEVLYEFITSLIKDNVGREGLKYFSVIFTVFLFVWVGNILGLLPYAFTFTSHLTAVGVLSIMGLLFNICVGIKKKGWGFLHTFMPKGVPIATAPLIVPIELISYMSKPFSLTVRLVANMTVGHIMLKIIAGFVFVIGVGGIVPLLFNSCIVVFEIFVGTLQAYIYTVLTCIYLSDALHEH